MGGMKPTLSTQMQPPILFLKRYTWSAVFLLPLSLSLAKYWQVLALSSTGKNIAQVTQVITPIQKVLRFLRHLKSQSWSCRSLSLSLSIFIYIYIHIYIYTHHTNQLWVPFRSPQESQLHNERGVSSELRHVTEELKQKAAGKMSLPSGKF